MLNKNIEIKPKHEKNKLLDKVLQDEKLFHQQKDIFFSYIYQYIFFIQE